MGLGAAIEKRTRCSRPHVSVSGQMSSVWSLLTRAGLSGVGQQQNPQNAIYGSYGSHFTLNYSSALILRDSNKPETPAHQRLNGGCHGDEQENPNPLN